MFRITRFLVLGMTAVLLLAGCQAFVTPIPPLPTEQLPSASTLDPALLGTLSPYRVSLPQTATPLPPLALSNQPYRNPQNLFTMRIPEGWVVEQSGNQTRFLDPDGSSWINMQVLNTRYPYDADSFARLVDARESNTFGGFLEYGDLDRTIQAADGIARITKSAIVDDKEMRILSYYRQDGSTVLVMDCWSEAATFFPYLNGFEGIINSLQFDGQAAATAVALSTQTFRDEQYALSFEVPEYWLHEHISVDNTNSDTFSAPDQRAAIQSLVYEDDEEVNKQLAGEFSLVLLREYYNPDIVITRDDVLTDGSERLEWYSPGGKYHGVTIFRIRDNMIWLATSLVDDAYQGTYQDLLESILQSASFD